jgi:hypothetical protein
MTPLMKLRLETAFGRSSFGMSRIAFEIAFEIVFSVTLLHLWTAAVRIPRLKIAVRRRI